jgi:hypothetical protein
MPVGFDNIAVGQSYSRDHLAEAWGYKTRQAISRGVVTPAAKIHNLICNER